jgi:hypothetical protein
MNLFQRLLYVAGKCGYLQKDASSALRYSFISHDKVTGAVRGPMAEVGLFYYSDVLESEYQVLTAANGGLIYFTKVTAAVTFVNTDKPEERLTVRGVGIGLDPSDKSIGKAVSYAVKYALLKGLMMETGDDPEKDDHRLANVPPVIANDNSKSEPVKAVGKFFSAPRAKTVSNQAVSGLASPAQISYLFRYANSLSLDKTDVAKCAKEIGWDMANLPAGEVDSVKGRLISLADSKKQTGLMMEDNKVAA